MGLGPRGASHGRRRPLQDPGGRTQTRPPVLVLAALCQNGSGCPHDDMAHRYVERCPTPPHVDLRPPCL